MSVAPVEQVDDAGPARRRSRRRGVVAVLALVAAGGVTGALSGWAWEWLWTPPTGAAWKGEWFLDREGLLHDVDATGWYTVVGLVAGVLLGGLAARFVRAAPLAVLLGVTLGALLHAWVMYQVGHALGPDDPYAAARGAVDWEPFLSDLRLAGVESRWWPFASTATLAPAVGALLSLVGVFFGHPRRRR